MIKINVSYDYDQNDKERTPMGVRVGKELMTEVVLTNEEAAKIVQSVANKLSYKDAKEFIKKFEKAKHLS